MIKIFSIVGMALALAVGLAYTEDTMPAAGAMGDKIIRNEDLSHIQLDPDQATLNRMPAESSAESGIEGSAAGGVSSESDRDMDTETDIDQGKMPADNGTVIRMWH